MVAVVSADGKMTQGDDSQVRHWSSSEDYEHFSAIMSQHQVVVMGRKTYEAVRPKPQPERLRVVLTTHPQKWQSEQVPGSLEFTSESPKDLVTRLEAAGHTKLMLVGGAQTNAVFLEAGLVNELQLTVEPMLFGSGADLLAGFVGNVPMKLLESRRLNERGTFLLHYQIVQA